MRSEPLLAAGSREGGDTGKRWGKRCAAKQEEEEEGDEDDDDAEKLIKTSANNPKSPRWR